MVAEETAPEHRVLIVDDDDRFRDRLAEAFSTHGWSVTACAEGGAAMDRAVSTPFAHAVIDLRMPGMDGLELLRRLRAALPSIRVVVLTGYGSIATAVEAVQRGAVHYLTKPAGARDIIRALTAEDDPAPAEATAPASAEPDSAAETAVPTLARAEWEHIQRVLVDCNGNISKAARLLGLHRRSLQRKLAKFPVD